MNVQIRLREQKRLEALSENRECSAHCTHDVFHTVAPETENARMPTAETDARHGQLMGGR